MIHSATQLHLVFEWIDMDLEKFMKNHTGDLEMPMVKVCAGSGGAQSSRV